MFHANALVRLQKKFAKLWLLALCVTLLSAACYGKEKEEDKDSPFACQGDQAEGLSVQQIRDIIKKRVAENYSDAPNNCITADLMRRVGDNRTSQYFRKAIDEAPPDEGAYELFYADYLRNFRGPVRPLFREAEKHYFRALNAVGRRKPPKSWDRMTRSRVQRALIALYQEDGVTLAHSDAGLSDPAEEPKPVAFFASINRFARSTADLDREQDDIRDYTSEALFSASPAKTGKPLDRAALRGLVRLKTPFETFNRIRFRFGDLPSVDMFSTYRHTPNEAVNDFSAPHAFNGLVLYDYGVAAEKPFSLGGNVDVDFAGSFSNIHQRGLLEFTPRGIEAIHQYEVRAAVSKFVGPDKVILQFNYAYQAIHPETGDRPDRDRELTGAALTYQLLRPHGFKSPYDQRFEIRSWDFFCGFLLDNEAFNDKLPANNVTDIRRDYFAGAALKGMGPFDLTIQPTLFSLSSSNPSRAPASNSQYRTNVTVLYRIVDEECTLGVPEENPRDENAGNACRSNSIKQFAQRRHALNLAFWQLVVPIRHDVALHNLNAFENYEAGIESDWKFFTVPRRITFLASIGYGFQRFYRLNKNENILTVSLKMGFN